MTKEKIPVTLAVRFLKEKEVPFIPHLYAWEEKGGTGVAARELHVTEHQVIKTLVMEDDHRNPFLVLMHGDKEVSTKNLARILGVKTVEPCDPRQANLHTGYIVGGISPFGTKKPLKIFIESTILDLERIYINAGKRGFLVEISPMDLARALPTTSVTVAV
jgi:Cys-tRNA(Pro) deacylase